MWTALIGLACAFLGLLAKVAWDWLRRRRNRQSLKDRVSRWWQSGLAEPPQSIQYRTRDGVKSGRPVRASGLHLVVESGARGMVLVGAGEAVDRDEFWRAWRYFCGQAAKWVDEEGDEWVPGG